MKIHFIGIGGIGVSALAQYYLANGHEVSGCDLVASEITDALRQKGVKITIGKNTFDKRADLTIYSPAAAIPKIQKSREQFSTFWSYPEALGDLTKKYFTIAVAGTHGKSTTTAMIGLLLAKAGLDPTVIVGTKVKEFGNTNCRVGKSRYLVIEADEHFASFVNYWPQIIVITNVEADHLDYYKNFKNVQKAFDKFIKRLPKDGILMKPLKKTALLQSDAKKLKSILKVPGEHNILNSLAALATARALKIPDKISFQALSEFKGTWRRFDMRNVKMGNKSFTLVSDYAHHPTEISVTLKAMREKWPDKEIWCVFQPHQYQRTYYLFDDFVKVFRKVLVDKIIITDIYDVAGRENKKIKRAVNSEKLVKKIASKKVIYLSKNIILNYLSNHLPDKGILTLMGAGDIYDLGSNLVDR